MDIKIYEDQTGLMIYPEKRTDKNKDIVRLFDNRIELFIKKYGDIAELTSYVLVKKGLGRAIGCYIIYKENFTDSRNYFRNFKEEANKVLTDIGFTLHDDIENENAIFTEIQRFDSSGTRNVDTLINAINSGETDLSYSSGNISEIAEFINQVLQSAKNVRISISQKETNLAELNIIRKRHDELLVASDKTKQALVRQETRKAQKESEDKLKIEREQLEEKRRKELADEKIKKEQTLSLESTERAKSKDFGIRKLGEGFNSISEGALALTNAGLADEILKFNPSLDRVNKLFKDIEQQKAREAEYRAKEAEHKAAREEQNKYKQDESNEPQGRSNKQLYIAGLAGFFLILIAGTMIYAGIGPGDILNPKPKPTPVPEIIPTPIQTIPESWKPTETAIPIIQPDDTSNASNNIQINKSNISENNTPIQTNRTQEPANNTPIPTANYNSDNQLNSRKTK